MKYTVVSIDEDVDFGCEERLDTECIMAVVVLKDEIGNETIHKFSDQSLYDKKINQGDEVYIDERGDIQKASY